MDTQEHRKRQTQLSEETDEENFLWETCFVRSYIDFKNDLQIHR